MVAGQTLREKRRALLVVMAAALEKYLEDGGFAAIVKAPAALVVPTGFILAYFVTEETLGLRITVAADDSDAKLAQVQLQQLVDEFPEVRARGAGYTDFLEYLQREY